MQPIHGESWWLIFKGNYTHLIESPPRLKLGEATWRGAVGPRTSLSVQLLFARWAPLVCYSALSQVSKRFPKYPFTATHATTNVRKARKERKFDVPHQTLTLKTTLYVFIILILLPLFLISQFRPSTLTRIETNSKHAINGQTVTQCEVCKNR